MSVLLLRPSKRIGSALVNLLTSQGDTVRVIEADAASAARWKELGAYVAQGSEADADLVERAAQDVRTVVVFEDAQASIEAVLEGAELAGVERLVVCTPRPPDHLLARVRASRMDYVVLKVGSPRLLGRARRPSNMAEAIDAADDLGGHPRLEVDLEDAASRRSLDL
ncbi:MAG: NAD-binding protein [Actinomycetota bacterium]|nr:NAD-binding protein [Actinomycetota bacterium]